jgi:hypothetical protein
MHSRRSPQRGWRCSFRGSAGELPRTPAVNRNEVVTPSANKYEPGAVPADHGIGSDNCKCIIRLGKQPADPPSISLSSDRNGSLLGLARRSTLICCRSTTISASSVVRDRSRSITVPKISLHKSNIEQQHRPILDQTPADWIYDRDWRYRAPRSRRCRTRSDGPHRCCGAAARKQLLGMTC